MERLTSWWGPRGTRSQAVSSLTKEEPETGGGGRARETKLGARHPGDRYRFLWTSKSSNIELVYKSIHWKGINDTGL